MAANDPKTLKRRRLPSRGPKFWVDQLEHRFSKGDVLAAFECSARWLDSGSSASALPSWVLDYLATTAEKYFLEGAEANLHMIAGLASPGGSAGNAWSRRAKTKSHTGLKKYHDAAVSEAEALRKLQKADKHPVPRPRHIAPDISPVMAPFKMRAPPEVGGKFLIVWPWTARDNSVVSVLDVKTAEWQEEGGSGKVVTFADPQTRREAFVRAEYCWNPQDRKGVAQDHRLRAASSSFEHVAKDGRLKTRAENGQLVLLDLPILGGRGKVTRAFKKYVGKKFGDLPYKEVLKVLATAD